MRIKVITEKIQHQLRVVKASDKWNEMSEEIKAGLLNAVDGKSDADRINMIADALSAQNFKGGKVTPEIKALIPVVTEQLRVASEVAGRNVFHLEGDMGIGKTYSVMKAARSENVPLILLRPASMEVGDFTGRQATREIDVDGKKIQITDWLPPKFVAETWKTKFGIVFIDEINRCEDRGVRQVLFSLVENKKVHTHQANPNWIIVTAGNPSMGKNRISSYHVAQLDPAFWRRVDKLTVEITKGDWLDWAEDKDNGGVHEWVTGFIGVQEEEFLHRAPTVEDGENAIPNPAGWVAVSDIIKSGLISPKGTDIEGEDREIIAGKVGFRASQEFANWVKEKYEAPLRAEEIFDDPGFDDEVVNKRFFEYFKKKSEIAKLDSLLRGIVKYFEKEKVGKEEFKILLKILKDDRVYNDRKFQLAVELNKIPAVAKAMAYDNDLVDTLHKIVASVEKKQDAK